MFNLTQEERRVVLFLAATALIGTGSNFLLRQLSPAKGIACFSEGLGKIKLNSADKKLLLQVSGIGEKLAGRIIDYRDKHAGFRDIDELLEIEGITEPKLAKIREYLAAE